MKVRVQFKKGWDSQFVSLQKSAMVEDRWEKQGVGWIGEFDSFKIDHEYNIVVIKGFGRPGVSEGLQFPAPGITFSEDRLVSVFLEGENGWERAYPLCDHPRPKRQELDRKTISHSTVLVKWRYHCGECNAVWTGWEWGDRYTQ